MPGLLYTDDAVRRAYTQAKGQTNGYPGISQYDSRHVISRPTTQTTAYGLNEPQWSEDGPPPITFQRSPYARVPLPPLASYPITINPLLSPNGPASIIWSIDQHPSGASCNLGYNHRDHYHWKMLPAMSPGDVISLTIFVQGFRTPVVIPPRANMITIGEVLAAVYHGARRAATDIMYGTVGLGPEVMWAALAEYNAIITQDAGPPIGDDEVSVNIRQYTKSCTKWVGLVPSPTEPSVWILQTKSVAAR